MEKKVFTTKNQSIKETIEVYKNKEVYETIKKV